MSQRKVVVTGARGGVGVRTVEALLAAGHEVIATDRVPPLVDYPWGEGAVYYEADLTDAGSAFAIVREADAVVHAAAIPTPEFHPAHVVFANNMISTFNVVEAAVRWGVPRFVNVSSETVPGFIFAERPLRPAYLPVDEEHPIQPQDPYGLAKHFGEQMMDAAVRRSDMGCISIRPSWVQHPADYARHLAAAMRDPRKMTQNAWSYTDALDLADALVLAAQSNLSGHQIVYVAAPDNMIGRPLADLVAEYYGDAVELRPIEREDASGISSAKATRILGYAPQRTWRTYLDAAGNPL